MSEARRNTDWFKEYVGGFTGWKKIIEMLNRNIHLSEAVMVYIGLFLTGSRVSELCSITPENVSIKEYEGYITIKGMKVLKQKDKIYLVDNEGKPLFKDGKRVYNFKSKAGSRTFLFPAKEPLAKAFMKYVSWTKPNEPIFPFDRKQIYYRLSRLDGLPIPKDQVQHWSKFKGEWYPHRLRSERICQLIRDYDYNQVKLKQWVGWQTGSMIDIYSSIVPKDLIPEKEVVYR